MELEDTYKIPEAVNNLPKDAKEDWLMVFIRAKKMGLSEKACIAISWTKVKQLYGPSAKNRGNPLNKPGGRKASELLENPGNGGQPGGGGGGTPPIPPIKEPGPGLGEE